MHREKAGIITDCLLVYYGRPNRDEGLLRRTLADWHSTFGRRHYGIHEESYLIERAMDPREDPDAVLGKILIEHGLNPNRALEGGWILEVAIKKEHTAMAMRLIDAGAEVNRYITEQGSTAKDTPLTLACAKDATIGMFRLVEKLLEKGANPNLARTSHYDEQKTPLGIVAHGLRGDFRTAIIYTLLLYGASVSEDLILDAMRRTRCAEAVVDFAIAYRGVSIVPSMHWDFESARLVLELLRNPPKRADVAQEVNAFLGVNKGSLGEIVAAYL